MASNYLREQFNTHIFGSASYTKPSVLAIALCSSLPNHFDTGATIPELPNSGGYERQNLNPSDLNWTITGGVVTNAENITFPIATADWDAVEYIAILDDATWGTGNLLFFGGLDKTRRIHETEQLIIEIGSLIVRTI
jgi:hypothetical protein